MSPARRRALRVLLGAGAWILASLLTGPAAFGIHADPVITGEAAIVVQILALLVVVLVVVKAAAAGLRARPAPDPTRRAAQIRAARARAADRRTGRNHP